MPVFYYPEDDYYPEIVKAVSQTVLIYITQTLYKDEAAADLIQTIKKRLVISNIAAGSDVSIGDAIEKFQKMTIDMPFTAYNILDSDYRDDEFNHLAKGAFLYCEDVEKFIATWPKTFEINLTSFFGKADDYQRARTLLDFQNVSLTRLSVPLRVGTVDTFLPADVGFEISAGSYPQQFEEYLRINKIWDLVHNVTVKYYDLVTDGDDIHQVDDIFLSLSMLDDEDQQLSISSTPVPDPPTVVSISPADGTTNESILSNIVITFSTPMIENSVLNAISIDPFVSGDYTWNDGGTVVIFNPIDDLESGTLYDVEITTVAKSGELVTMENDFTSSFTTES